jgi:hypothetical protein
MHITILEGTDLMDMINISEAFSFFQRTDSRMCTVLKRKSFLKGRKMGKERKYPSQMVY